MATSRYSPVQHMYADLSFYENKSSSSRFMGCNFCFRVCAGTASNPLANDNSSQLSSKCEKFAPAIPLPPSPDLNLALALPDTGYACWGAPVQQGFPLFSESAVVHAPIQVNIGSGPSTAPIAYMVPAEQVSTL
jgi:hypothetical protein